MPTTDLATDLHKQAEAATHGYATKTYAIGIAAGLIVSTLARRR